MVPCRYLLALYIENRRPKIDSWREFSRAFGPDEKTVRSLRYEYGIHESVGPNAKPSPDFHGRAIIFWARVFSGGAANRGLKPTAIIMKSRRDLPPVLSRHGMPH